MGGTGPRPVPGSAISPPWSAGNCGCGGPTSSPPTARKDTGASLARGLRTTSGPGMRSGPCLVRVVAASEVPPGRVGPGSNGTEQTRPSGDARWRVATRPSGTTPPNAMASGSAWGADFTTYGSATSARSAARGCRLPKLQPRPSRMPWLGDPSREGKRMPLRNTHQAPARGPRELASTATGLIVLDPNVPKPPGPAVPRAQVEAPALLGGSPQEEDPRAERPIASAPTRAGRTTPSEPQDPLGQGATGPACMTHGETHGGPGPEESDPMPSGLQEHQGLGSAHTAHGGPQGIRAFLGLGPSEAQPHGQRGAAVVTGKAGKPIKAQGCVPAGALWKSQGPHPALARARSRWRWNDQGWRPRGTRQFKRSSPTGRPVRVRARHGEDAAGPVALRGSPWELD